MGKKTINVMTIGVIIAVLAGLLTGIAIAMVNRLFKISVPWPYGVITVMVMLSLLLAKYLLR